MICSPIELNIQIDTLTAHYQRFSEIRGRIQSEDRIAIKWLQSRDPEFLPEIVGFLEQFAVRKFNQ
jgi:hypothetical protein